MIYTTCIMCYATFSFSKSQLFRQILAVGLVSLSVFITVGCLLLILVEVLTRIRHTITTCKIPIFTKTPLHFWLLWLCSVVCMWWRFVILWHAQFCNSHMIAGQYQTIIACQVRYLPEEIKRWSKHPRIPTCSKCSQRWADSKGYVVDGSPGSCHIPWWLWYLELG